MTLLVSPIQIAWINLINTVTLALEQDMLVMEIFYLFLIRNIYGASFARSAVRGTGSIWLSVSIVTGVPFAIAYLPHLPWAFATRAAPLVDGLLVVIVDVALFDINEIEKQLQLRLRSIRVG